MFDGSSYDIDPLIKNSIDNFAKYGIPPGGFVTAVLENDLMQSFGRADLPNRRNLFEITKYVYNEIPSHCWGSKEKVEKWGGLEYYKTKREEDNNE